ncbi:MAG: phosphoadenylyl-sulfate reductase [Pseudomonadota bacterium]
MPLELPPLSAAERAAALNARLRHHSAASVLERALTDPQVGRTALVTSFGAESVALLHLVSVIDRTLPVIFLETEMLFPETLAYQAEVARFLALEDVRIIRPSRTEVFAEDVDGILHLAAPDACCDLRKTRPLARALEPFDAWITGRKRFQGGARQHLDFFEADGEKRLKINPLAFWNAQDLQDYMTNNRLPRHPLVARGYPSIGCTPCTSPVFEHEDPRAGRWRGNEKTECGIHFSGGKAVRPPANEGDAA